MTEAILNNEATIRLGFFLGIFALMAILETIAPRRARTFSRLTRWPGNLGIVALNTLLIRVLFPVAAVGLAVVCQQKSWGLLNNFELPNWLAVLLAVALFDLIIYLQHVMFHAVPVLWRLHRMHHTDLDLDVTSGARFHPIEIVLSMAIKMVTVIALGPPVVAVVVFEVLLNGTAMFNHGNVLIPVSVDRVLRLIFVTPDMHRVHHSIIPKETNSNFGFNLPWWDRLFRTYRAQPEESHTGMTIGIEDFRSSRDLRLDLMLLQPFKGKVGIYPFRKRH
jgi:sterol desaturase/sphingolipid hydroxylase (fatty acid hydroxylase superfamily)